MDVRSFFCDGLAILIGWSFIIFQGVNLVTIDVNVIHGVICGTDSEQCIRGGVLQSLLSICVVRVIENIGFSNMQHLWVHIEDLIVTNIETTVV